MNIRANENQQIGINSSQKTINLYKELVHWMADNLNPLLQSFFNTGKELHLLYNTLSTFASNQGIVLNSIPTVKKMLKLKGCHS